MLPLMQGMQAQGIHRGVEMGSPPHHHYHKQHRRFQQAALSLFCLYACSTRLLRQCTTYHVVGLNFKLNFKKLKFKRLTLAKFRRTSLFI